MAVEAEFPTLIQSLTDLISHFLEARLRDSLAILTLTAIVAAGCGNPPPPPVIHATLVVPSAGYVLLKEPVKVIFDRTVKGAKVVTLTPATDVTTTREGKSLLITPASAWQPGTSYQLKLGDVTSTDGGGLKQFSATFKTQPRHGVAGFLVGGQPVTGEPAIPWTAHVTITFTDPMNLQTTQPTVNGQPVAAAAFKWAEDGKSVEIASPMQPYQKYVYGLGGQPAAANGEALTDSAALTVNALPTQPSNSTSGVTAGFKAIPPIQIVIEDSAPSRPQSGFQKADMVFEFLSEYGINRMTAMYFNRVAENVGPIRSCRSINAFLVFGYGGLLMCAGVADGTQHYIPGGGGHGTKPAAAVVEDLNAHQYFYRSNLNVQPHNLYTNAQLAEGLRSVLKPSYDPSTSYVVDPPHPDNAAGQPVPAPSIPVQGIGYSYSEPSQSYLRFDRGSPSTEGTGPQIQVKNIVVMHTAWHFTNWSEDGCCAYSVWYEMTGTGPAEVYSNGRLVRATWHMGSAGQVYMDNTQPIWFSDDASGLPLELNTGLTWVHVVGNGQTG